MQMSGYVIIAGSVRMTYRWQVATQNEFNDIYSLIYNSKFRDTWNEDHMKRRVIVPLFLNQLITFYNEVDALCGFMTIGFLSPQAAEHQSSEGIRNEDWRSGNELWVIDFLAVDGGGAKMLRTITKSLNTEKYQQVKYFRLKYKQNREVFP